LLFFYIKADFCTDKEWNDSYKKKLKLGMRLADIIRQYNEKFTIIVNEKYSDLNNW